MGGQGKILLHRRFILFYKKNTLSLFLSFVLTFMLASAILVLIHTNHRTENIEYKTIFTPSDCLIEDLSWQQVQKLKDNPSISHIALQQEIYNDGFNKNGKTFYLHKGDGNYITLMAKVIEGRLPEKPDEVVAEKWVLLNLGVQPEPGQEFELQDSEGRTRTVKVSGILSGMRGNISYGTLILYAGMDNAEDISYTAYITFKNAKNHDDIIKEICRELKVKQKQARKCPAREDFNELFYIDIQITGVILFVCLVIFYGIYKIVLVAREKQYGILRALGMGRRQMFIMVLSELYQIYFAGALSGTLAGICLAWIIANISGDAGTIVYLYNKSVEYNIVVPVHQIIVCIIVMAVFTGAAGYSTCRSIIKKPLAETISGAAQYKGNRLHFPGISGKSGKICTLFSLSCNYILKNIKLSIFVIITMCTGIMLFTGLAYKLETLQLYRSDTKESWYLNGQYEMSVKSYNSPYQGVSRQAAREILEMDGVEDIKTSAGICVRVVDENGVKRNDKYYNKINADIKKYYGYGLHGHDGTNQVYKTSLCGYNSSALKELKKYVVSGSFDVENIKEDEI
ncbi:MAG: ABC transporter permease, partial [Lachnospiraceae bacterium]|nr:ABC transporter permease [Lachnospiraceae bacterium]